MNCTKCGFDNKADALFCKKCGADLTDNKNIISRMNGQINILAVFIGLIFSIVILFIGALSFGGVITSGFNISIYVGIVLLAMAFFGSIVTGMLGGKNLNEGYANGVFLSLFILVFVGFVLGIVLFVFMGIAASLASALGSFSSVASTHTTTSSTGFLYNWLNLIEVIGLIIMLFLLGGIGGALGVFIKNSLK